MKQASFRWALGGALAAAAAFAATPALAIDGYKFLDAVKKSDVEEVKKALASTPQIVNTHDTTNGQTALMIAAARSDLTWLQYMLAAHADVNGHDDQGLTALVVATRARFAAGVQLLVQLGARVDVSDRTGETPLITAVHNHDFEMMRILLGAGADPDRADNSGRSARDYARLDLDGAHLLEVIKANARAKSAAGSGAIYGPR